MGGGGVGFGTHITSFSPSFKKVSGDITAFHRIELIVLNSVLNTYTILLYADNHIF